jgi:SAM-dependent methyltransferase
VSVSPGPASPASNGARRHWEEIYGAKGACDVSWYQREPDVSLALIERSQLPRTAPIIDVGGGASSLAARLVARDFTDVTVLDISPRALELAREELGANASRVSFIEQDLFSWSPQRRYDLWHDRALFHFLVDPWPRERYAGILRSALSDGGTVVIGTFAADGPERCSGLPVARFGADALAAQFGDALALVATSREEHRTPAGWCQPFTWVVLEHTPDSADQHSRASSD